MSKFLSKKVAVLAALAAVVVAATAYAYLSASGSGTGSGAAASGGQALVLSNEAISITGLEQSQTVDIFATNASASPLKITTLNASVSEDVVACANDSFTVESKTITAPGDSIAANTTTPTKIGEVVIKFNNRSSDQVSCLGNDVVKLAYNVNAS